MALLAWFGLTDHLQVRCLNPIASQPLCSRKPLIVCRGSIPTWHGYILMCYILTCAHFGECFKCQHTNVKINKTFHPLGQPSTLDHHQPGIFTTTGSVSQHHQFDFFRFITGSLQPSGHIHSAQRKKKANASSSPFLAKLA